MDIATISWIASAGVAAVAVVSAAGLSGFRSWCALKRFEVERRPASTGTGSALPATAQRIDIADLRERIRKLEAIAAGVDL